MKNFKEFTDWVKENITAALGEGYENAVVNVSQITKGNDLNYIGLSVMPAGFNAAPTLNLEQCYKRYMQNGNLYDTLSGMADTYRRAVPVKVDIEKMTDLEAVRDHIQLKLVSTERSTEFLKNKPHTDFMDMSAVYRIVLQDNELQNGSQASIPISNSLMKTYGLSVEELHEIAMENLKNRDMELSGIGKLLAKMTGMDEQELDASLGDDNIMYVLSNKEQMYGAALVLDTDKMDKVADKLGGNLIVLPSSVNEVIILPESVLEQGGSYEEFKQMVQEVNATALQPDEYLSDNVFVYDAREHELMIVDDYIRGKENNELVIE